jgi:hypothetical protein
VKNSNAWLVTEYGNQLYFVTAQWASVFEETSTGAEVWRCTACTGGDWEKVADAGFGSKMSLGSGIAVFKDQLYVGLSNWILGAQVWRCTVCDGTDWEKANTSGFGNEVQYSVKLFPFEGKLYAFANGFWGSAFTRGTQMFVSANGKDWTGTLFDGWGSGGASSVDPVAEFQGSLYAGVSHDSAGAEIWQMLPNSVFIPSVKR